MIEYILSHSPDSRILKKATDLLDAGELICLPTDTNWVILGSTESKSGIEKLYKVKKEGKQKHYSIHCSSISMASEVALISNTAFKIVKKLTPGNYTFIFEASKKIAKYVQASKTDKEVGIRIVPRELINSLIEAHHHPLIGTNISPSILGREEENLEPIYSYELEDKLRGIVRMILDPGEFEFDGLSSIINFTNESGPELMREGVGSVDFLR